MASFPRIVFYGTPEFAAGTLRRLVDEGFPVAGVVTAPDKPSGRGLKLVPPVVKRYALETGLKLMQPASLKDPQFLETLRVLSPDLQIVVAFRMMPREVWSLPPLGTFNLHASLLPEYRGAAPINWVIIRGETETGVTTFFLDEKIDTGAIIFQERTEIGPFETAGELHDRLMHLGAGLVIKTVRAIAEGTVRRIPQSELIPSSSLKTAPKFTRDQARIEWIADVQSVFNLVRGMSPYPGAFTALSFPDGTALELKVLRAIPEASATPVQPGSVVSDGKTFLKVAANGGYLRLLQVQPSGRKVMEVGEFLNGFGRHFF